MLIRFGSARLGAVALFGVAGLFQTACGSSGGGSSNDMTGGAGGATGGASAKATGGSGDVGNGGRSTSGGSGSGGDLSMAGETSASGGEPSGSAGEGSGGSAGAGSGGTTTGDGGTATAQGGNVAAGAGGDLGAAGDGAGGSAGCVDTTDDAVCAATYGAGTICSGGSCVQGCRANADCSGGQVCLANNVCGACTSSQSCGANKVCSTGGSCVTGTCTTSVDCDAGATAGEICGATAAYSCGACQSDQDCSGDAHYNADGKAICISGKCTTGTCTSAKNATCANGDACCSGSCVAGSKAPAGATACCGDGDCGGATPHCVGNACTSCAAAQPEGGVYKLFVNPTTPATNAGTGTDNGSCAFSSIGRALAFVNTLQAAPPVAIYLSGNTSAANGEVFPIALPANVKLQGASISGSTVTGATRKISVSSGQLGVAVTAANDILAYLDIDGANGGTAGLNGISVIGNSAALSIDHVTVENMSSHAVLVGAVQAGTTNVGGALTINAGVTIQKNGTAGTTTVDGDGLLVRGSAHATIGGLGLAAPVLFSENADHAIAVFDAGSVALTGEVTLPADAAASGTVTVTGSGFANVYINQSGAALPSNEITGLLSTSAKDGRGLQVLGGSKLVLRKSALLGNATTPGDGLRISANGTNTDVSGIDLGTRGDDGQNTFQLPDGSALGARNAAGICLSLKLANGTVLPAEGNYFTRASNGAKADCTAAVGTAVAGRTACANFVSVGGIPNAVSTSIIDVSSCTIQFN